LPELFDARAVGGCFGRRFQCSWQSFFFEWQVWLEMGDAPKKKAINAFIPAYESLEECESMTAEIPEQIKLFYFKEKTKLLTSVTELTTHDDFAAAASLIARSPAAVHVAVCEMLWLGILKANHPDKVIFANKDALHATILAVLDVLLPVIAVDSLKQNTVCLASLLVGRDLEGCTQLTDPEKSLDRHISHFTKNPSTVLHRVLDTYELKEAYLTLAVQKNREIHFNVDKLKTMETLVTFIDQFCQSPTWATCICETLTEASLAEVISPLGTKKVAESEEAQKVIPSLIAFFRKASKTLIGKAPGAKIQAQCTARNHLNSSACVLQLDARPSVLS
jgi:hypothetical protein